METFVILVVEEALDENAVLWLILEVLGNVVDDDDFAEIPPQIL